jgi:hypothetical protein
MLIVCLKFTVFGNDIKHLAPIDTPPPPPPIYGFHKSRDLESFIILNFVVLYSSVFKLYSSHHHVLCQSGFRNTVQAPQYSKMMNLIRLRHRLVIVGLGHNVQYCHPFLEP